MNLFGFHISRRASGGASVPASRTGAVIRSAVALPGHAKVLKRLPRLGRMYDAAATDRLSADFPVSLQSANAEILVSALAARSRARRLERDNPYAWGLLNTFQNNVAGHDPFRLQMRLGSRGADGEFTEERETNQLIEDWWQEAGQPEHFTVTREMSRLEAYLQAVSALVRDGGILWKKHRGFPKNKFRYAIEPLEIDLLDHNWNRPATGTNNEIRFGIETDEFKGPVAYWLLNRHPGDIFAFSPSTKWRERIAAEDVIALFDIRTRAGQLIGMPRFASIIKRMHREDQWDVAYVTAAIYAACKQIYLMQEMDPNAPPTEYKGDETSPEGEEIETVEPGVARILPRGYKPFQLDPKFPMESSAAFKKDNLRAIGTGSGVAYHTLANDLEGVNFSSGRLGENAQRDEFKKLQSHIITKLVHPDFCERLKYAILSGELPGLQLSRHAEYCRAARFIGKRWPYVNPVDDAKADQIRIQEGLDSRSHIVAESERGGSYADVCAEQCADARMAEQHGLKHGAPEAPEKPEPDDDEEADPPAKKNGRTGGANVPASRIEHSSRNGHSVAA